MRRRSVRSLAIALSMTLAGSGQAQWGPPAAQGNYVPACDAFLLYASALANNVCYALNEPTFQHNYIQNHLVCSFHPRLVDFHMTFKPSTPQRTPTDLHLTVKQGACEAHSFLTGRWGQQGQPNSLLIVTQPANPHALCNLSIDRTLVQLNAIGPVAATVQASFTSLLNQGKLSQSMHNAWQQARIAAQCQ
ncbi:hypothetical protein FQU96_31815 [Reyranella sp. CPCC 100927]|nr:hypothetical protein FQU96_31815 [Reyranella sp. CPCC 100927]